MPEIASQRKAILAWVDSGRPIHLFLTLHNTESADYIDGPLTAGGPEIRALGHRFQKLLDETTAFFAPKGARDMTATTTPGVDKSEKLGREPTVKDRLEFGAALIRVLAAAIGG
jgi:hypothetical protein